MSLPNARIGMPGELIRTQEAVAMTPLPTCRMKSSQSQERELDPIDLLRDMGRLPEPDSDYYFSCLARGCGERCARLDSLGDHIASAHPLAVLAWRRQLEADGQESQPVQMGELTHRERLALSGLEDSPAYSIEVAREERAKREPRRLTECQALILTRRILQGPTAVRLHRGAPTLREQIDADQRSVLKTRDQRPLTEGVKPRRPAEDNLGPEAFSAYRNGKSPAFHYHEESWLPGTPPSFMFREGRTAKPVKVTTR